MFTIIFNYFLSKGEFACKNYYHYFYPQPCVSVRPPRCGKPATTLPALLTGIPLLKNPRKMKMEITAKGKMKLYPTAKEAPAEWATTNIPK